MLLFEENQIKVFSAPLFSSFLPLPLLLLSPLLVKMRKGKKTMTLLQNPIKGISILVNLYICNLNDLTPWSSAFLRL